MSFITDYLDETKTIIEKLDPLEIEALTAILSGIKKNAGRLFILGVGGSAANASHAVNDFRKICGMEVYAPTDNVSELTARTNDEGWETVFSEWLKVSHLTFNDALLIFSVGGGNAGGNISVNLINAIRLAKKVGAKVLGIVGRDGGYTAQVADVCIVIPPLFSGHITPHTEGLCGILWHLIVNHPLLRS